MSSETSGSNAQLLWILRIVRGGPPNGCSLPLREACCFLWGWQRWLASRSREPCGDLSFRLASRSAAYMPVDPARRRFLPGGSGNEDSPPTTEETHAVCSVEPVGA